MKVVTSRLVELLTEADRDTLFTFVDQIGDRSVIVTDPVILNSYGEFRDNVLICSDRLTVENLEILAFYVANVSDEVNCTVGIVRPDILKYISSPTVKYKPLAALYSYRLPSVISCWNKVEMR